MGLLTGEGGRLGMNAAQMVQPSTMSAILAISMARAFEVDPVGLLAAAKGGDAAAQASFFEQHKLAVARQVMRMTGDASIVDDLVQEVFIAAFRRLDRFRGDASIDTWLQRITMNKVRNWWDSRRRRLIREERVAQERGELATDTADGRHDAERRLAEFYRALDTLPAAVRDAFVCRSLERLSLEETSERLGVPLSTVSYRARRGEVMLCEALGIEGEDA